MEIGKPEIEEIREETKTKVYDVTQVLEKFGRYQYTQFLYVSLPLFFVTMVNINYIFTAGDLKYRCRIPECEGPGGEFNVSWWPNATVDRCSKPLLRADHALGSQCTNESFSGELGTCEEWVYESNNTVVATLNLACQPWKMNLIGTVHSAGILISRIVSGWISDKYGRKPVVLLCGICSVVGQLKTFASSYYVYITIELIEAALVGGNDVATMVIMLEICGKHNRIIAGIVFAYITYTAECMYAVIAMYVPYWKHLIYIINGPAVLFIGLIFLIRESPRWQIVSGNAEKAKQTLLTVAKKNKININREELADMNVIDLKNKFNIGAEDKREGLREIVKSKEVLKRAIVAAICRFTVVFVYYGMMINSVYLPGNKHTNFLLSTVMSYPGELLSLYLMNKFGRKYPLLVGFLISGLLSAGIAYVPPTYTRTKILLFLLGKTLVSMCFTGMITYILELFPTSARGSLLGSIAFFSRCGAMLAPLTPILNPISVALPSILFACSSLVSAALLTFVPETKDLPLMDTIKQVEESVRAAKEKRIKSKEDNAEIEAENPLMPVIKQ